MERIPIIGNRTLPFGLKNLCMTVAHSQVNILLNCVHFFPAFLYSLPAMYPKEVYCSVLLSFEEATKGSHTVDTLLWYMISLDSMFWHSSMLMHAAVVYPLSLPFIIPLSGSLLLSCGLFGCFYVVVIKNHVSVHMPRRLLVAVCHKSSDVQS